MKIALLVLLVIIALAIVAYYIRFPRNTFISVDRPTRGTLTFSRTSVSLESPPDHYVTNGLDRLEPYVSRLLQPTKGYNYLGMFTPDGIRGFGIDAKDGLSQATLTVEWRKESGREAAIRSFFSSLGIAPSQDYLAGNGEIPDATRILEYPINGNTAEVTSLAKRILQELCGISPTEALDITFSSQDRDRGSQ